MVLEFKFHNGPTSSQPAPVKGKYSCTFGWGGESQLVNKTLVSRCATDNDSRPLELRKNIEHR